MTDVATVVWKELREGLVRRTRGSRYGGVGTLLLVVAIFGVLIPANAADEWDGVPAVAIATAACVLMVMTAIPDSFAGERDRQTLETLLATRLPDEAILLGKQVAATIAGAVMALVILAVSLVTVNVTGDDSGIELYSPLVLVAALGAVLLTGFLIANVGVLVSLRAPSAQAAQRILAIGMFGLTLGGSALASALPADWRTSLERFADRVGTESPVLLVVLGVVALIAVNAGVFALSRALFRRPKLIRR